MIAKGKKNETTNGETILSVKGMAAETNSHIEKRQLPLPTLFAIWQAEGGDCGASQKTS